MHIIGRMFGVFRYTVLMRILVETFTGKVELQKTVYFLVHYAVYVFVYVYFGKYHWN